MKTRLLAVASVALLLAACAGAPPPKPVGEPDTDAWRQRLAKLGTLTDWVLRGRIAVVNGDEGGSGSLIWLENSPHMELQFSGPFGIGGFRIHGTPNGLFIETDDGTFYTSDPARYLARRLGGPVPVASLRYWALGMPDPASPARIRVDEDGLLRRLEQNGWTVSYQRFGKFGGWTLPTRLEARRADTRIKLVVDEWSIKAQRVIVD